MNLPGHVFNERMLLIISASLRFARTNGAENLPVRIFVKQYGFTRNFSRTEKLSIALKEMVIWVDKARFSTGRTPSKENLLKFIKDRI